jgi:ATP-dependent DNA ligase
MVVQDEHGLTDFNALRSAIYTAPHRLVLFAFDLLHLDGQDLRRTPLMERRTALRKLIEPVVAPRSSSAIMRTAMVLCSSSMRLSLAWRASSPSGPITSTAAVRPGTG